MNNLRNSCLNSIGTSIIRVLVLLLIGVTISEGKSKEESLLNQQTLYFVNQGAADCEEQFKYNSYSAVEFVKKQSFTNLFLLPPPLELGGPDLCTTPTINTLSSRAASYNDSSSNTNFQHRIGNTSFTEITENNIALLFIKDAADFDSLSDPGSCSYKTQVENIAKLNELYATQGGQRIKYILLYLHHNDDEYDFVDHIEALLSDEHERIRKYDLQTVVIFENEPATALLEHLRKVAEYEREDQDKNITGGGRFYLNREAFLPSNDINRNTWFYLILIVDTNKDSWLLEYLKWIIVAQVLVIVFPILYVCILRECFFHGRRSEEDLIPSFPLRNWRRRERRRLSICQVEQLPSIKYNETDLEMTMKKYFYHLHSNSISTTETEITPAVEEQELVVGDKGDGTSYNNNNNNNRRRDVNSNSGEDHNVATQSSEDYAAPSENIHMMLLLDDHKNSSSGSNSIKKKNQKFTDNAYSSCTSCSVCLSDFKEGELLRLLPHCGHFYHHDCLLPWLTLRKNVCPLCNVTVETQDEDDSSSLNVLYDYDDENPIPL